MQTPTILIVDDDAGLRKTLTDIFRANGYETCSAGDGAEAMATLGRVPFDLALIDLQLPDMSGLDVLYQLKTEHPDREAIILTGNATLGSALESTNRGAFSYLLKPYDLVQLLTQIKRALEKRQAQQTLRESENKFRDLSEKSLIGIYLIQNGLFTYVNPKFADIFGYNVEEIVNVKSPFDLVSPEDRALVRKNLETRLTNLAESSHYEARGVRKNGTILFAEIYGNRTTYQGTPAVIGTLLDITERKRYESEREKLIAQLREALSKVKTLSGLLPICSYCKRVRNDEGYWNQIEVYIRDHSEAEFSHGLCPDCQKRAYEEFAKMKKTGT